MSSFRVAALAIGAGLIAVGGQSPASAQGLSQFGNWGGPPAATRSPSYLGAPPAVARSERIANGGGRPSIRAKAPQTVSFDNRFEPGSIVIDTASRKLYYTLSQNSAYAYPVAVGRQGFTWTGVERVSRVQDWPDWHPPADMRKRDPRLPIKMTGGVRNPLGAKAIYLGKTLYRIHGTNETRSIGTASSSGCIRMHNGHVVHLAHLIDTGTPVFVMRKLPKSGPVMPPGGYQPKPAVQEVSAEGVTAEGDPAAEQTDVDDAAAAQPEAESSEGAPSEPAQDGDAI